MAKTNQLLEQDQDFVDLLVNTFRLIGKSWDALVLNILTFILVGVVPAVVMILAVALVFVPFLTHGDTRVLTIVLATLAMIFALIVVVLFLPAVTITQLASARGKKVEFNEVFKKSRALALPYLGLTIIVGLTVIFGTILIIIPGIIAAFFLSMSTYIMADKNPGVIKAYKQSYYLVKENILVVLALFLVNIGVSVVSYIPFVGWIASLALSIAYFCLPAIIYTKIAKK
jgi:hypothetical protein